MKRMRVLMSAVLVVVLLLPTMVSAQGSGITWNSGFQVQNLESTEATIEIIYYNQDGTVAADVPDTIPALGSKTYSTIHEDVGTTFNGSVVISSNTQVVAIANLLASGTLSAGAATNSFSAGAMEMNLPLIMRGNWGFNTWFNVQNTGTSSTNVTVTYNPGTFGNPGVTDTAIIPAGAAATFDQETKSGLGDRFVGSAVVTSDSQVIVATVEQAGTGSTKTLLGYNGFTGGSATVVVPLVTADNWGYTTGIQVQNISGNDPCDVTVTYSANTVPGMGTPTPDPASIAVGASHTFGQSGGQWTARYVGAATITGSGCNIVAIVNQLKGGALSFGTAYEGFDPTAATSNVSAPLVVANNYGYATGIQVQNVSGASPCNVTVTYSANTVPGMGTPTPDPASIAVGASHTFGQSGGQWTARYVGSAIVTGSGCNIVAIVNNLNGSGNDQFLTYNGFNY
ncbi:MAG: hypothetical protein ISS50_04435 [Anaerolineae bacterium]|nr:hypothetical protein [Anaerolineae bacterium]